MTTEQLHMSSGQRILSRLLELRQFGLDESGSYWRAPFTDAETAAVDTVMRWMRDGGMTPRRDAIGNCIGRVEGRDGARPAIVTGSHLDSVRDGGVFDGCLGVVAGVEAVAQLVAEFGPPLSPIEAIAYTGEEGSRFVPGLLGSRMMAGLVSPEVVLDMIDDEGVSMRDALVGVGLNPAELPLVRRSDIGCAVELHIEQGPVLEQEGIQVGIVHTIAGLVRGHVTVLGQADHAGTTPLARRRDALLGTAEMLLSVTEAVRPSGGVVTCGRIAVQPGSGNVVVGRADWTFDLRHHDRAELHRLTEEIRMRCRAIAERRRLTVEWTVRSNEPPEPMAAALIDLARRSAEDLGLTYKIMASGAGHDSRALAAIAPVVVLFTPCRNGMSHRPDEFADAEQIEPGFQLLKRCLHRLAYQPDGLELETAV